MTRYAPREERNQVSDHYGGGGSPAAAGAAADDRRRPVRPIAPLPRSERERDPQRLPRDTRRNYYGRQPEAAASASAAARTAHTASMHVNTSYNSSGSDGALSLHSSIPPSEPIYLDIENDNLHQQQEQQYQHYQQHRLSQSLPVSSSSPGRRLEYSQSPGRQQRALHSSYEGYESSVTRQPPVSSQSPYHGQSETGSGGGAGATVSSMFQSRQSYTATPQSYQQQSYHQQSYQHHQQLQNNSSRKADNTADATPIMFGDPYEGGSVVTGMSQQDLLRKKSREHRSVNKKFKKKKKDRIVNLPAGLSLLGGGGGGGNNGGGNNNGATHNYNGGGGGGGKSKYLRSDDENSIQKFEAVTTKPKSTVRPMAQSPESNSRTPSWMNPATSLYHLEEKEGSTAESTNESVESGVVEGPLHTTTHALDYSYSGIGVQQGVMNERSEQWLVAPSDAYANGPESDARSLGGESLSSFPLLSTSAGKGIAAPDNRRMANPGSGGMDSQYDHNADIVAMVAPDNRNTPRTSGAATGATLQTPMSSRRGVRFAEKLATLEVVYDRYDAPDCLEIPWDEQLDSSGSPTSVREVSNMDNANYRTPVKPSKNGKTVAPTKPVSILRHRRFVAQVGSPNFIRSRRFAGTVSSPPRYDASGIRIVPAPPVENKNTMLLSPPRNVPDMGFVDVDGFALSPIRPSRMSYDNKDASPARGESSYGQQHLTEKRSANAYYAARRVIHQQDRPGGYAESVDGGEIYPDPPLELDFDEESTVASLHTGLIEAVAAIVVQTTFRRYMGAKAVEQMRARSRVPIVPMPARLQSQPVGPAPSAARSQPVGPTPPQSAGPALAREQPLSPARTRPVDPSLGAFPVPADSKEFETMAHRMYDLAAVKIQSEFRGFWVRDCLNVDHYCAAVIQKAFRRFRLRNNSHYDLFRIVIVQAVWRRNIARGNASNKLAHIIAIQAGFRGSRARRKLQRHLDRMYQADRAWCATRVAAALAIQSRWRSTVCETHFITTLVDVLIVQTVFRRWSARRHAAFLRKAVAKRNATRNLVQQVDDAQRLQIGSTRQPFHISKDNFRNVPENELDVSYEEPGQIISSAIFGPPEVHKSKHPTSEFKPVKQVEESDVPSKISTPAPKAVDVPSEIITQAPKAVEPPAIYSKPVEDESSDLAVPKVQEDDVPPDVTISVRREAQSADADSRAAKASIEAAYHKVQECAIPSAVTLPLRRDAKPPAGDFKPLKESSDLSFEIVQEDDGPPAVMIPGPKEEKSESAAFECDDPGEAGATNLLAMWKNRDEKNTLVLGRKR